MAVRGKLQMLCLSAVLAAASFAPAAQASKVIHYSRTGWFPPKTEYVFDDSTRILIWQTAHDPSLMNVDYLKYIIGLPENYKNQTGPNRHYYWYDNKHQVVYELIQNQSAPGQVTQAQMIFHLEDCGLTFKKLDKYYGNESRRFYDYNGHPNELFTFAPNTFLSFGSPANSYRLSYGKIMYNGDPLPPPSPDQMALAEEALVARANASAVASAKKPRKLRKGEPRQMDPELLPLLIARVKSNPADAEAHLQLAQALQREAHVNDAIGEYKLALALSGENGQVRAQSIKALQDMKILSNDDQPPPRRNLEIVDNGQHMRVVGHEKKPQDNPDDTTN